MVALHLVLNDWQEEKDLESIGGDNLSCSITEFNSVTCMMQYSNRIPEGLILASSIHTALTVFADQVQYSN
jgi:hypothetical protein